VYLVGSATARNAIEALARRLGCDLEVHLLERKAPLTLEPSAVGGIKALRKGDALIAFSRKDVLSWAEQLTRAGFSVATIYGNLSPEVRQAQAAAFRNGIADIIVGTDAIGMGLNLPIARVVFTTALKYDGYDEAQIPAWLAQQIGGRAGRFGLHEAGAVAGFDAATHRAIGKLLKAQLDNLPSAGFYVSPTVEHLKQLADETGENKLEKLLTIFKRNIDLHDDFFLPTWLAEQLERAAWLDGLRLTLEERFLFSLVPLTLRVPAMKTSFEAWARNVERNQKSGLPHRLLGTKLADLQQAEDACKEYSGYAWLSYRMPSLFPDGSAAVALAQQASMAVHRILLVQNTTRKQKTSKGSVLSYLK
jgi:ATP-dependent RNA helicase SUPV3L1/SUV3